MYQHLINDSGPPVIIKDTSELNLRTFMVPYIEKGSAGEIYGMHLYGIHILRVKSSQMCGSAHSLTLLAKFW